MAVAQFTWTQAASRMNEILTAGLVENCRAVEVVSLTVAHQLVMVGQKS
jgi:hypothetical protein